MSATSGSLVGSSDLFAQLPPITLDELDAHAALQERVDRKYVLTNHELTCLIDALADQWAVLQIDGRRHAAYQSVYFDTEQLDSYRAAAHKRRRRFKVRTRTYLDTSTTLLEVKTKGRRGRTVKRRTPHAFNDRDRLDDASRQFVDETTTTAGLGSRLSPTLTTEYRRTTLADLDDVARLTVDAGLRCTDWCRHTVALSDRYVVETKSTGVPSRADRWLWSIGCRPEKISKFATGLAALHPELPSNKWHRTLRRHFPPRHTVMRARCGDLLAEQADETRCGCDCPQHESNKRRNANRRR